MPISPRFLGVTLALALATTSLSACGESTKQLPDEITPSQNILPTSDAALTAMLPTGANTFTYEETGGAFTYTITGYVNFDDCSTMATGTRSSTSKEPAKSTTYDIQRGGGMADEAIRENDGAWISRDNFYDVFMPAFILPWELMSMQVATNRGIACGVKNLPVLATVDPSTGALVWSDANRNLFVTAEIASFASNLVDASAIPASERAAAKAQLNSDLTVSFDTIFERARAEITKDNESTELKFRAGTSRTLLATLRFTPTAYRTVQPVEAASFFDAIRGANLTTLEELEGFEIRK